MRKYPVSKKRRASSIVLGIGLFGLILRLLPVVAFFIIAAPYLSPDEAAEKYTGPVSPVLTQEYLARTYFNNPVHQARTIAFGLLAAICIWTMLSDVRTIFSEYRRPKQVAINSAKSFLTEIGREQFVLVLRPFGSDGQLFVMKNQTFWRSALFPSGANLTIEQVVSHHALEFLGCRTVAVVDPETDELAPGPEYVSCEHDWRSDVSQLVARAQATVLIVPPSYALTPSLIWELSEFARWGFRQRCLILVPGRSKSGGKELESVLNELEKYSPITQELELTRVRRKSVLGILPDREANMFFYEQRWPFPLGVFQTLRESTYRPFLSGWFTSISQNKRLTVRHGKIVPDDT